ncbi:MAG: peptide chain release factor N(5)-glutamine methyltransferase [Rhodospirillaceae bacterium]
MAADAITVQSALANARRRIDAVDAKALLCAVLGRDAAYLIAHAEDGMPAEQALTFEAWVQRRAAGEPVAYITGWREFYGRTFRVTADVLIPRPETELLVDVALAQLRGFSAARVLDLGTGSGCIGLTLAAECVGAHITGVDASEAALAVARSNAARLGIDRVEWRVSNWFDALGTTSYEVIVSNPPYVAGNDEHLMRGDLRYEPRAALTPGGDGLDAIRHIVRASVDHLRPGGSLWFEHGYDQGAACRALLRQAGYTAIATHRDLAGIERVTGGRRI